MKLFGLIGFPLTHSFSKKYFSEKFEKEGIKEHAYELFELENIQSFPQLIQNQTDLCGLNVTIPHKQAIMPFLDGLDASASKVGAVNVIKITSDKKLIGYNSDYYGFKESLETWLKANNVHLPLQALILGDGGAAKAVKAALRDLGIAYQVVSRKKEEDKLSYQELSEEIIQNHRLIINASPIGTYPKVEECPDIPYHWLTAEHFLYDLVYNPLDTLFLKKGQDRTCQTHNGLTMLHLQAEKAWEIWNQTEGN